MNDVRYEAPNQSKQTTLWMNLWVWWFALILIDFTVSLAKVEIPISERLLYIITAFTPMGATMFGGESLIELRGVTTAGKTGLAFLAIPILAIGLFFGSWLKTRLKFARTSPLAFNLAYLLCLSGLLEIFTLGEWLSLFNLILAITVW